MTSCTDREPALNALLDGELDALNAAQVEAHVQACAACGRRFDDLARVRAALAPAGFDPAPAALRTRIEAMIAAADAPPATLATGRRPRRYLPWLGGGVAGALAASLALLVAVPQVRNGDLPDQLVAGHIRSLQAGHLTDVVTSDRHVVKPWFNGRLDFSPPVVDLSAQGYPLVGGRLDYMGGREVAALVYRRRLHTINLFVRPVPALASPLPGALHRQTYNLTHWAADGLEFWAVSDVGPRELEDFQQAFKNAVR